MPGIPMRIKLPVARLDLRARASTLQHLNLVTQGEVLEDE